MDPVSSAWTGKGVGNAPRPQETPLVGGATRHTDIGRFSPWKTRARGPPRPCMCVCLFVREKRKKEEGDAVSDPPLPLPGCSETLHDHAGLPPSVEGSGLGPVPGGDRRDDWRYPRTV